MMGRCGTCRFWGKNIRDRHGRPQPDQGGEWRQCGRVVHDDDSVCMSDDELIDLYGPDARGEDYTAKKLADPVRRELAVVKDGSGYFAALKSRSDFGCVLYETGPAGDVTGNPRGPGAERSEAP